MSDDPFCRCGYRRSVHDGDLCPHRDGFTNVLGRKVYARRPGDEGHTFHEDYGASQAFPAA